MVPLCVCYTSHISIVESQNPVLIQNLLSNDNDTFKHSFTYSKGSSPKIDMQEPIQAPKTDMQDPI